MLSAVDGGLYVSNKIHQLMYRTPHKGGVTGSALPLCYRGCVNKPIWGNSLRSKASSQTKQIACKGANIS